MSSGTLHSKEQAAQALVPFLRAARAYLALTWPRVCSRCHHVFSRDARLDMRCPDCAAAAAEREAVRL